MAERRRVRRVTNNIVELKIEEHMGKTTILDETFFGEVGITSKSAEHTANLACERVDKYVARLGGIRLYNTDFKLVGDNPSEEYSRGWSEEDLLAVDELLEQIGLAHAYKAWVNEAIKQREHNIEIVNNMTVEDYCATVGVELPEKPVMADIPTRDEIIAGMTVKERNKIYMLQAMASTYGKYIHPTIKRKVSAFEFSSDFTNNLSSARKVLANVLNNPRTVKGEGRDAIVYTDTPSVEQSKVEEVFLQLMAKQRDLQAELNGYMRKIDMQIDDAKRKAANDYAQALADYEGKMEKLRAQLKAYKECETQRISGLKIVIPNDLKALYDELNALGK